LHKAFRTARKNGTPALRDVASISKAGYFKVIKAAKNKHWSSFRLTATISKNYYIRPERPVHQTLRRLRALTITLDATSA